MQVYIPYSGLSVTTAENLLEKYDSCSNKEESGVQKFINKTPKWTEEFNAYVLDFRGRATYSSVKNFLLIKDETNTSDYILFGKVGKDLFNLDVKYPFTIVQGIALAVSSFEKKIACE
jgi:hypothetical protein